MELKNSPLAILSKGRYLNDTYFVLLWRRWHNVPEVDI
jgi:hypothetical protein